MRVLLIGLRADAVDYEKWPGLSPEKLNTAFDQVQQELADAGFQAEWALTDRGETAEAQVVEALERVRPGIVLIGAGVRTDPDYFLLFEKLINTVMAISPGSKICFNTLPFDSVKAVKRWA
ncbi:MAG: hypothetical protein AAGJ46_06185 [Planctomycetota bacterium]